MENTAVPWNLNMSSGNAIEGLYSPCYAALMLVLSSSCT
jgi:hypothetical protein